MSQPIITPEEFLVSAGLPFIKRGNGRLAFDKCPFCGRKNKFSVDEKTGQFNCFSSHCSERGGFISLVAKLSPCSTRKAVKIIYGSDNLVSESTNFEELLPKLDLEKDQEESDYVPVLKHLPRGFSPVCDGDDYMKYLVDRGLRKSDLVQLGLQKTTETPYYGNLTGSQFEYLYADDNGRPKVSRTPRVVFPVQVENGDLIGYVARAIVKSDDKNGILKVLNCPTKFRQMNVWGFNYCKNTSGDVLVVCEGIISALKFGLGRSIATFGKMITDDQIVSIARFARSYNKKVILCLDPDAYTDRNNRNNKTTAELVRDKFNDVGVEIGEILLPPGTGKNGEDLDSADYTYEENEAFLNKALERAQEPPALDDFDM